MRICFLAQFDGGGTERATFLLANSLREYHDVFILNTAKTPPTFALQDITMDYLPKGRVCRKVLAIRKYIINNKIDILVALEALGGICALPAAKLAGCKIIIWEHANYYQTQGSRYAHIMRKLEMLFADAYVVLTKRDLKNFKTHFRYIRTRLVQIYNIIDLPAHRVDHANSRIIISAGHIRRIKNFSVIPEIAQLVFRKHPDWIWKIYGSPMDDEYDRLLDNIEKCHMKDNVLLCGRCSDMANAYQEAALYVMTSLQEGFPMVLLEAKAHGLPLVSFDIETGPDEIIENGENGFLITPYDIHEMAEKIIYLIENEEVRRLFSENATHSSSYASKELIVSKWLQLYSDIEKR